MIHSPPGLCQQTVTGLNRIHKEGKEYHDECRWVAHLAYIGLKPVQVGKNSKTPNSVCDAQPV